MDARSNAQPMLKHAQASCPSNARTYVRTNATNERIQDTHKNVAVLNAPTPVDNPDSVSVNVRVAIPARTVWLLEQAAERRGMSLSEFLLRSAEAVTGGKEGPDAWLVLYRAGFTDKAIGQRLGWTNRQVQDKRRAMRLPANRLSRKATT